MYVVALAIIDSLIRRGRHNGSRNTITSGWVVVNAPFFSADVQNWSHSDQGYRMRAISWIKMVVGTGVAEIRRNFQIWKYLLQP